MSEDDRSRPKELASTSALDPARIVYTIGKLQMRIHERFPDSALGRLAESLHDIGENTKARLDELERPILWIRAFTWAMAALLILGVAAAVWALVEQAPTGFDNPLMAVTVLESGIQDAVFIGIALAFLITAESRLRRRNVLAHIRDLRAIAHIVDMHQLTKDPHKLVSPSDDTASSPRRTLTNQELGRYLDYCSEMLSLTSKLAALYAERFNDPVVLQAVDEVEMLTTGLSAKIWQKIMILDNARRVR